MRCAARLLASLAMLGGLVGAPPSHADSALRDVPFVALADGESTTAGAAMLKVARSSKQASELAMLAGRPELAERLAAVDFGQRTVIGIFSGPKAGSGHAIAVKAVQVSGDTVRVTVESTPPRADQNVNDVISYPYAIIAVPHARLPVRATWSAVGAGGEPLVGPGRR